MNDMFHCSSVQIDDIKQKLRLKQMEEEDHQKRINNTRRTIEDLKTELAKVGDQPDVTPRINAVNVELRHIQEERAKIEGEKADLRREKDNLAAECISEFPKNSAVSSELVCSVFSCSTTYNDAHGYFNSTSAGEEAQ